jgi:hypothetical protein
MMSHHFTPMSVVSGYPKKWLVNMALFYPPFPLQAGLLSKTRRVARGLASWSTGEDSWLGAAGAQSRPVESEE